MKTAAADPAKRGIFNNAAQAWNHSFYWNSLKPKGGGKPEATRAQKIDSAFGNDDGFREEYLTAVVDGLLNWEFTAKNLAVR